MNTLVALFLSLAFAASPAEDLHQALLKLTQGNSPIRFLKIIHSPLMAQEKTYTGTLLLRRKKFKLETGSGEIKTTLEFNGTKYLLTEGTQEPIVVKPSADQINLVEVFKGNLSTFKVTMTGKKGPRTHYLALPKKPMNLTRMDFQVENSQIKGFTYTDELENEVTVMLMGH